MKKYYFIVLSIVAFLAISCNKGSIIPSLSSGDASSDKSDKEESQVYVPEGCFYFEAVRDNAYLCMNSFDKTTISAPKVNLQYSINKTAWKPLVVNETKITLEDEGDRVYIRANGANTKFCSRSESYESAYNSFYAIGLNVAGNIMFLLDSAGIKDNFDPELNKHVFAWLFYNASISDASELILPAKTLAEDCYLGMFCNCQSLQAAPALPATKMVKYCYDMMFDDCKSLTTAPVLPASALTYGCYSHMFDGCTKLSNVEVDFTDWRDDDEFCTYYWLDDVSKTGTFTCPYALHIERGDSRIPKDWEVVRK